MKEITIEYPKFKQNAPHCDHTQGFKHCIENAYFATYFKSHDAAGVIILDTTDSEMYQMFTLHPEGWVYDSDLSRITDPKVFIPETHTERKLSIDKAIIMATAEYCRMEYQNQSGDAIDVYQMLLATVPKTVTFVNNVTGAVYHGLEPQDFFTGSEFRRGFKVNTSVEEVELTINEYNADLYSVYKDGFFLFSKDDKQTWSLDGHNKAVKIKSIDAVTDFISSISEINENDWRIAVISPDTVHMHRLYNVKEELADLSRPVDKMTTTITRAVEMITDNGVEPIDAQHKIVKDGTLDTCYFLLVDPEGKCHGNPGLLGNLFISVVSESENVLGSYFNIDAKSYPSWQVAFNSLESAVNYFHKQTDFKLEG